MKWSRGLTLGMDSRYARAVVIGATLLIAGCSDSAFDLWPTLTGSSPAAEPPEAISIGPSPAEQQSQPLVAAPTTTLAQASSPTQTMAQAPQPAMAPASAAQPSQAIPAPTLAPGATGTFVGAKVVEFNRELETLKSLIGTANAQFQQLRGVTEQNAQRYYAIVAAVSARLQIVTTPGNPVLVSQWNTAQSELDRILTDIAALNTLANDVASQAAMSSYLTESIGAAYNLSGAVEEDHRQLAKTEDEVNRTVVLIDRLLGEINDTIARQTAYVNNERRNLTTLSLAIKNGEMFGPALANRAFAVASATAPPARQVASAQTVDGRQPLVVIRFDREDVPFQQALYTAVSQAIDRRPSATFDVVAVTPNRGTPAQVALNANVSKRNAERVFRALADMGLPGDRVTLSATTSTGVSGNEVHVYVR